MGDDEFGLNTLVQKYIILAWTKNMFDYTPDVNDIFGKKSCIKIWQPISWFEKFDLRESRKKKLKTSHDFEFCY